MAEHYALHSCSCGAAYTDKLTHLTTANNNGMLLYFECVESAFSIIIIIIIK